jgi:hypothetical protein
MAQFDLERNRQREEQHAREKPWEQSLGPTIDHIEPRAADGELGRTPDLTGVWADSRTALDPELDVTPLDRGGAFSPFLDPSSYALSTHRTPLLERESIPTGAIADASADLYDTPVADGGGFGGNAGAVESAASQGFAE